MKLDKNYKVRVTPEQSREIQELVFGQLEQLTKNDKTMKLDDFLKCKKVKCVDDTGLCLTKNKEYQLVGVTNKSCLINCDDGYETWARIERFEPVLDSAENPLQNMKLTPEFETEASEPKFKVGDKVYYGIRHHIFHIKTIQGDFCTFTNGIKCCGFTNLCHATQENYERLQATFTDIEFERPLTQADIDNEAVDKLAQAMKDKLAEKREQGYHGWETCKHSELVQLLINHVDKGDPIDVANFCAFLFARGEQLTQGGTR